MKKLMIVGSFPAPESQIIGGIATSCRALLDSQIATKFEVLTFDSSTRQIPPPALMGRLIYAIPRIARYCRIISTSKPDCVLIFAAAGASYVEKSLMCLYAKIFGAKVIFSHRAGSLMMQLDGSGLFRWFARSVSKFPDAFICQGETWAGYLVDHLRVEGRKCHVIMNWTATNELLKIGKERTYLEKPNIRILFLGWLDTAKGIMDLIQAFKILLLSHPLAELHIAGGGALSAELSEMVETGDLQGSIILHGWLDGDTKDRLIKECDIFCLPSYSEGLPNAMVEAMAAGLPVLVTSVGMVPDIITDGENGVLVPVGNTKVLADKLQYVLEHPEFRRALGRAACSFAAQNMSIDTAEEKIFNILKEK